MANPTLIKSFVAEAAVNPYRIVKLGAADGQVLHGAAATDAPIGVADMQGQSTVGGRVDVVLGGIADVEYGGTVTRGALLVSDGSGRAVVAAPAGGTNNGIIGRALLAGVVGDIGSALVTPVSTQG